MDADTGALHGYELTGDTYRERTVARPGDVLDLGAPVPVTLDPGALLRR